MIEIDDVSVDLGGARVIDGVSAEVSDAGVVGLVGPNGAGKTTLLRAVAGLVAYHGTIRVAGTPASATHRRTTARLVAYVPQRPVLPPAMLVGDYVLLGRSPHHSYFGADTRHDRRVVAEVLDRLDLAPLARRPLGQVSGGEAQRAVLGRALAQQAPVLLMDEPTASLDLGHGQLVLELADELRRERSLSVLCALHDLTLAAQYADRLIVMSGGRVVARGKPAEVLTVASLASVFEASVEIFTGRDGVVVAPVRPRSPREGSPLTAAQRAGACVGVRSPAGTGGGVR
ncbi:MAG TPA: ABC transporter ATP-binding protein [Acidimicrobiales bacterium]|nr:ABC transporter ATP-binding protein [Acidimicrobiales bacterium]